MQKQSKNWPGVQYPLNNNGTSIMHLIVNRHVCSNDILPSAIACHRWFVLIILQRWHVHNVPNRQSPCSFKWHNTIDDRFPSTISFNPFTTTAHLQYTLSSITQFVQTATILNDSLSSMINFNPLAAMARLQRTPSRQSSCSFKRYTTIDDSLSSMIRFDCLTKMARLQCTLSFVDKNSDYRLLIDNKKKKSSYCKTEELQIRSYLTTTLVSCDQFIAN